MNGLLQENISLAEKKHKICGCVQFTVHILVGSKYEINTVTPKKLQDNVLWHIDPTILLGSTTLKCIKIFKKSVRVHEVVTIS